MEKDIRTYYMAREKNNMVEGYINRIFMAATMEEAVQAYLDMRTCLSPEWIETYLNKSVMIHGKMTQIKNLAFLKTIIEESKKYIIASFDVIMGIEINSLGEKEFLTCKKREILPAGSKENVLEVFHEKRNFYQKINQAIQEQNIDLLESFYQELNSDPCYQWAISYFGLQESLERKKVNPQVPE